MKRETKIAAAVVAAVTFAGVFGFAVDRPVLYRFEFLPVAGNVDELKRESISNKLQRAIEWRTRYDDRRKAALTKSVAPTQEDVAQLRYWSLRVRALEGELRTLEK